MKTYQVKQKLSWACPGMLIFVDDNGYVVGHQQNPNNTMTQFWVENEKDLELFDPEEYEECVLLP